MEPPPQSVGPFASKPQMIVFPHWEARRLTSLIQTIGPQTKSWQSKICTTRPLMIHVPSTADALAGPAPSMGDTRAANRQATTSRPILCLHRQLSSAFFGRFSVSGCRRFPDSGSGRYGAYEGELDGANKVPMPRVWSWRSRSWTLGRRGRFYCVVCLEEQGRQIRIECCDRRGGGSGPLARRSGRRLSRGLFVGLAALNR